MIKLRNCAKYFFTSIFFVLIIYANFAFKNKLQKPSLQISSQESEINFNEDFYRLFNLGQKRLISSFVWTHTLLFSDTVHLKNKNEFSWMYHRFNAISIIDPLFYENYQLGGKYLGIIKDDLTGAENILHKGLGLFPNDFWISYQLGFNYIYLMNQQSKGLFYFESILNDPIVSKNFQILPLVVSRLKQKEGMISSAISILTNIIKNTPPNSPFYDSYKARLDDFKNKQIKKEK